MPKTLEELLAMSNQALEHYATTLQPTAPADSGPWLSDDLAELRARLEGLKKSDLSDRTVVRQIAGVRRCIDYKEAVARGQDRDEAWSQAFDRPLEEVKRIQARAAEIAAKLKSK